MKLRTSKYISTSGSVLVVTLVTAVIIGLTLASYLVLVQTQSANVERSQTWNNVMVVTEAGVEDALELVNYYAGTATPLENWTNSGCYSPSGWTANGNLYSVTRFLDSASNAYYTVYITNVFTGKNWVPYIYASGFVPRYNAFNSSPYFYAAGGLNGGATLMKRSVFVKTSRTPLFNFALAAKTKVDMNGNNIHTDSFDSGDTNYSNGGLYDPGKDKDGGDVLTDGTVTNSVINVGNAKIMGHAKTGPTGTITVGSQGSVGSKDWVNGTGAYSSPQTGPQSGWTSTDMNVAFDDVQLPSQLLSALYPLTGGSVPGDPTSYKYVFNTPGTYYLKMDNIVPFNGNIYVGTNVHVILWVKNAVNNYNDTINIAPVGASLTMYLQSSFSVSGLGSINNQTQKAQNVALMGLPTCTSIGIGGNAAFTGTIYAPEADISMNGGGSTKKDPDGTDYYDFVGSALGKSVKLNGHFHFHFDEALEDTGIGKQYTPSNWQESRL